MSHQRSGLLAVLFILVMVSPAVAQPVVTHPYPGITHITRTETMPFFRCPGCAPPPSPRLARINVVLVDLTAPEIRFKLTPPGTDLPEPNFPTPGWPLPPPPFEVVRQTTLAFLEASHAQVAINSHFFAPFPVPAGSTQGAYAYLIGLAASRGQVYSAFEAPFQNYALVTDAPALNIDATNQAAIVHRDPNVADGLHVMEDVQLWNAVSGSAQIVTNGVTTIPTYKDATHPDDPLTPNGTYTRAGRQWYYLSNARTAIGLTQDAKTLVLFTVDGTNGGHGMLVPEVADMLRTDYQVWNALNLDGGGSTTLAMQDPVTHVRRLVNAPSDNPPRAEASSLAVYSDGVAPTTQATLSLPANANGWHTGDVTVTLQATDLASGIADNPPGWVDQVQYAVTGAPVVVPGATASVIVTAEGVSQVTYFATDAAGNVEAAQHLDVRIDRVAPAVGGLPVTCELWPVNHKLQRVATVRASDATSGLASFDVSVSSSEPGGAADAVVTPDGPDGYVIDLRAERLGAGSGRVYTLTATATDRAGHVTTASSTCLVPHDRGRR